MELHCSVTTAQWLRDAQSASIRFRLLRDLTLAALASVIVPRKNEWNVPNRENENEGRYREINPRIDSLVREH